MISRIVDIPFWLITLWLLLWNILRLWPGDRWWAVAITSNFAPWLMITSFAITILSFLLKKPYLGLASLLAAILILVRFVPLFTANPKLPTNKPSLKVMTLNVYDRNNSIEEIISIIREQDPDIIALQELIPAFREPLLAELEGCYAYHTLISDQLTQGVGLLSRYKLTDISRNFNDRIISATVQTPQGSTLVVNVHAPSKLWPFSWNKDWKEQRGFFAYIADTISDIQAPVIILGDFNTTYLSENYGILHKKFRDAFEDSGRGFGFTYPAQEKMGIKLPWALVGNDFIFHNDYFVSSETFVMKESGGSDHHPVISVLGYDW